MSPCAACAERRGPGRRTADVVDPRAARLRYACGKKTKVGKRVEEVPLNIVRQMSYSLEEVGV